MPLISVTTLVKYVCTAMLTVPYKQIRIRSSRTLERKLGSFLVGRVGGAGDCSEFWAVPGTVFLMSTAVWAHGTRHGDHGQAGDSVSPASPHHTPREVYGWLILPTKGKRCFLLTAFSQGPACLAAPCSAVPPWWWEASVKPRHLLEHPQGSHGPPQLSPRHN